MFIPIKIKLEPRFKKYRFVLRDDTKGEYISRVELSEPYYQLPIDDLLSNINYSWKMQGKNSDDASWKNLTPLINLEQQTHSPNGKFYKLTWPIDESAEIYRLLLRDQDKDELFLKHVLMGDHYMLDISNINTDVTYYRVQVWKNDSWVELTRYAPIRIIKDQSLFDQLLESKDIPMDLDLFLKLQKEYENKRFFLKKSQRKSQSNSVDAKESVKSSPENNASVSAKNNSEKIGDKATSNENKNISSLVKSSSNDKNDATNSKIENNTSDLPKPAEAIVDYVFERASGQAKMIAEKFDLKGKRILDIGCDRGQCAFELAKNNDDCHITAIDIFSYPEWKDRTRSNLEFVKIDIGSEPLESLGKFDYIYSLVVWKHVTHPYSMLKATRKLLADEGKFFLRTNLYCGTIASHVFNDVYFPWPHLLFSDEIFKQFYVSQGLPPRAPSWVNNLTTAHYLFYFDKLGFKIDDIVYDRTPIDEMFYKCFEDKLGRFTRFDLETDFLNVELSI